ncbi:MAG: hypothetical protein ACTIKD_09125 [Sphingobacteriaceae bacterium]
MRKTILLLFNLGLVLGIVFFPKNSAAQQGSHIYIGYGTATAHEIGDEIEDIIITTATGGIAGTANVKYSGAIFAGYRSHLTERLEVGGTFVFETGSKDVLSQSTKVGSISTNSYAVLAELKYNYIARERFKLHSGVGAGFAHMRVSTEDDAQMDKEKINNFAYQVDAIGVTYGNRFSVSLNAGFGYKGIVNAVLAYGF